MTKAIKTLVVLANKHKDIKMIGGYRSGIFKFQNNGYNTFKDFSNDSCSYDCPAMDVTWVLRGYRYKCVLIT